MLSLINEQFIKAVQNNQLDELKNLLIQGADINVDNDIALIWSAHNGLLKIVKFLVMPDLGSATIIHGANIHTNDDAALRYSARFGHLEIVKFLVTQGANIHANNDDALRTAALFGRLEVVKFLIAQGANIHANNKEALTWSTQERHDDVWQVLSAFIQEEKLLVAASDSMLLVAAVGSTGASSCLCGMLVLPSASTWVCGTAVDSVAQNPIPSTKNPQRSKI